MGRFGVLLVASLLWPVAYAIPAEAQAGPTCRGVPATIVGTAGHHDIVGTEGDDVIVGRRGNDDIRGLGGNDLICGGPKRNKDAGADSVRDHLDGGPGDDTLVGGRGVDELRGGIGADLLIGRRGVDVLLGDADQDRLRGGPGGDFLSGDGGDDQVFGGPGPDLISDAEGNNNLSGDQGDDVIRSGPGNETMSGGRGRDSASYSRLLSADSASPHCSDITADLNAGTASGAGFGTDALDDIESLWTGGGNDVLIGDDGANEFYTGWFPCDQLSPTDSVDGNGGMDRIIFDSTAPEGLVQSTTLEVDLKAHTAQWGGQSANDILITLASVENVTGTLWVDVLLGDSGPNSFSGGNDNDVIKGREGDDELLGGRGDDSLNGGPGANTNDGGPGTDTCHRPSRGALAVGCER